MRSGQAPPAIVIGRSPMVATGAYLSALGGGARRYTMRICLLRHPGSIHMRRRIHYLASEGHDVHVLYFEFGPDTVVTGEELLPELAATRNVHLHCIPSRRSFSVAKASREALAAGSGSWDDKTVERPPRRTGLRAIIGRKAGAASLIARHPRSYLEVRLLGRSARRLARRTGTADTSLTVARLRNLRDTLKELKPDVLHAHDAYLYGYMGALSGFHPLVVSAWGSDVLVKPQESPEARNQVAFALREADVVATTSAFLRDYLRTEYGLAEERVARIPWGVDLKIFHRGYEDQAKELRSTLGIDPDSPVILSNRNLTPHFAIEAIVDAVPLVLRECPQSVFVFLRGGGSQAFEDEMRARAESLGVMESIRFVSRLLDQAEVAVHLNVALVTVSLARTDQFGLGIMESMACGAVPIVSKLAVYGQYLQDRVNAFFVDREDPQDVASKIIHCIQHPELQLRFHELNRAIIFDKENRDKNAPETVDLYRRLAPGRT